jgi:ATP-binding cassette, subfamily F, member 3
MQIHACFLLLLSSYVFRFFIDEVCTDVLHISGAARRLTQSHGNYTTWMARRQEQQLAYSRQVAGREAEIDKLKEYAGHGFRYGGSASQINKMQMKAKQAEKLEEAAKEQEHVWSPQSITSTSQ